MSSLPAQSASELSTSHEPAAVAAVSLRGVSRIFGNFVALRELSLEIAVGSSVVLLGENGAGKSTLLRLVAGLSVPSYGTVQVLGQPPQAMRGAISTMGHQTMLYDELTGAENLIYFAGLMGVADRAERAHRAAAGLAAVGLDPANPRRLAEYSQGMRQRASLARALLSEPELLLLDEPFSNLDVASAHQMVDRLLEYLAEPGTRRTLLLTTHQAALAEPLARTTVTLSGGALASVVQRDLAQANGVPR